MSAQNPTVGETKQEGSQEGPAIGSTEHQALVFQQVSEIAKAKKKKAENARRYSDMEQEDTLLLIRRHLDNLNTDARATMLSTLREMCGAPPFKLPELPEKKISQLEVDSGSESDAT